MATYDEAKAKNFANATTTTITGVPLEVAKDHPLRQAHKQPIQVCECVTKSCACEDSLIVWMDESAISIQSATGRQTTTGDELYEFSVDIDTSIVVESFRRFKATDLASGAYLPTRAVANQPFIVRRRPDTPRNISSASADATVPHESSLLRADPGCNDYEITESGAIYCFVESSAHYCIYKLC